MSTTNKMKALTLTVIAKMTSNYGESLGNIASVQKVFRNQKVYAIRSRESLKNALMVQSGLYNDLQTAVNGATQKAVSGELNAATCRALEGGYMNTNASATGEKGFTAVRKSSFYLTDAVSVDTYVNEARFHNNLHLAMTQAKQEGLNLQLDADKVGLMPYQYEYDKSFKVYSLTIDLEQVGKDDNFKAVAPVEERIARVEALLDGVLNLHLVVKGNLDNAEPIFAVGGLSLRKTHIFENVVAMEQGRLVVSEALLAKLNDNFACGLLAGDVFGNESEIREKLSPLTMENFFAQLKQAVRYNYNLE